MDRSYASPRRRSTGSAGRGRGGGALRAGLAGVLVRTGKYRPDAVAASGVEPTATVDSIADVPALLSA